jgi:hypothetical protein
MYGSQPGHPENHPQSLIAAFRNSFSPAALSGLSFAEIQAAVAEELTVMTKAPQIAGFGQNRKRHNGTLPRELQTKHRDGVHSSDTGKPILSAAVA